ncbi:MAG TPA: quinol:cytochrome C oxidoreductase [Ignavibacteriaceae bacterium]|nr:quinol:cytochrome C oxidoreductase [Ignavibacteriaceae bacterium]
MVNNTLVGYNKKELPGKIQVIGIILLLAGLALGVIGFLTDYVRALHNYLVMFMFLISIGVGSLFLITLEYIAGADWSVPFRRIIEFLASVIPVLFILVVPLIINMHDLFHWTHLEAVEHDEILKGKAPYLNSTFFIIRAFVFIAIWFLFYLLITRNSLKQDKNFDQGLTKRNIKLSAIFIPIFAISLTFSAIDWMMSLEPHWFSTIYGVYFFSGTVIAALAAATLVTVLLMENGYLPSIISYDHLYSFGALMFVFVNFWAYIAFSQYMLIWYADLPEETSWFVHRWTGGWEYLSIFLILVQFVVPYALLLSQPAKMDPRRLKIAAIWLLFAHFVDLYWLIIPSLSPKGYTFSWTDFVFPLMLTGLMILLFVFNFKRNNILAVGDPKLERGLNFHL